MNNNALIPTIGVVTSIRRDTPDVKTFTVVRADTGTGVCFKHMPGQCAMLSIPGVGEARKKRLLQHFGTVTAVKNAALEQLSAVVPEAAARAVYEKFHG